MADEIKVILDLSPDVQQLLEQQGIDLYQELQREVTSIRLTRWADPEAPSGSRDIITIISVTTGLISTLTPIILRILNMITPPNRSQTWIVEETKTLHPNGTETIYHKRVFSSKEQHPPESYSNQSVEVSSPKENRNQ